jgi:hypothetical protein
MGSFSYMKFDSKMRAIIHWVVVFSVAKLVANMVQVMDMHN